MILLTALLLTAHPLSRAAVQCPDGSPPPCRQAAPPRRPAPPLDARTWIVLPFENVARAADIEWLREASVNLLYLDLSRWRDIRVVDDERVADLIREVPEARAGAQMSLQAGMAVARRAGAGKLVMGDLLKVGARTQVVAKVYDVRSGQRLRTVRQETSVADSIMPIFGQLARGILDVAPPAGAAVGTIGTTSVDAFRAYAAGVSALNRLNLAGAHAAFDTALTFDSSFALAHYKLAVVIGWENPNDPRRRAHAESAQRFAGPLPPRERSLIQGLVHQAGNRWGDACDIYTTMLRGDSSDVEAWYNLGECTYHDQRVIVGGDSLRGHFRGSWNTSMRAFRRALELDPTYHLAFAHVPDILLVDARTGCRSADVMTTCPQLHTYTAILRRSGDSLVSTAISVAGPQDEVAQHRQEAIRTGALRANMEQARQIAEAWVQSGPAEPRAHLAMARVLLRLGRIQEASRAMSQVAGASLGAFETSRSYGDRLEILLKMDSGLVAGRLMDSLLVARPRDNQVLILAAAVGRFRNFANIFSNTQTPAPVRAWLGAWPAVYAGVAPANYAELERAMDSLLTAQSGRGAPVGRAAFFANMVPWSLDVVRTPAPVLDTTARDIRARWSAIALAGNREQMRRTLLEMDSVAMSASPDLPDASLLVVAAEGWVHIGDSARALADLLEFERRWPMVNPQQPMTTTFGNLPLNVFIWGRAWMRLGDLAAAANQPAVARRAYTRVADMWTGADAALQPVVSRARAALARL